MTAFINDSEKIPERAKMMDGAAVAEETGKIYERYVAALQHDDENSLPCVLSASFHFHPVRELPSGKGISDVIDTPEPEDREAQFCTCHRPQVG